MTMTADALDRYMQLDEPTAALVAAAYGTDPTVVAPDLERLDAVIAAVTAPMTPEEHAAPYLPDLPPVDATHLRRRIGAMDDPTRALFLAAWQDSGLPTVLADPDGTSALLDSEAHTEIEALICAHEPVADTDTYLSVKDRLAGLAGAQRFRVVDLAKAHGIVNVHKADDMTAGRLATLDALITYVQGESADTVAEALAPVADVELFQIPPDGTIADTLAWVGTDTGRARIALDTETARSKPRASLVSKLAQMVGEPSLPPAGSPPSAPPPTGPPSSGQCDTVTGDGSAGPASPDSDRHPVTVSPIADRLVAVADELYALADLLNGAA